MTWFRICPLSSDFAGGSQRRTWQVPVSWQKQIEVPSSRMVMAHFGFLNPYIGRDPSPRIPITIIRTCAWMIVIGIILGALLSRQPCHSDRREESLCEARPIKRSAFRPGCQISPTIRIIWQPKEIRVISGRSAPNSP